MTAHDGFTLRDLVSYNSKHNEANGDNNSDGHNDNLSWNCGTEGPTDDADVLELRAQQMRNFMATLLLSQCVPMILVGDERGHTQHGNNNAYCQDNELSWLDWSLDEWGQTMLAFTKQLIAIRRAHPVLYRRRFFQGRRIHGEDVEDVVWLHADGRRMTDEDWTHAHVRCLGMLLNGGAMTEWSEAGELLADDVLLLIMSAYWETVPFPLAPVGASGWRVLVDTRSAGDPPSATFSADRLFPVAQGHWCCCSAVARNATAGSGRSDAVQRIAASSDEATRRPPSSDPAVGESRRPRPVGSVEIPLA